MGFRMSPQEAWGMVADAHTGTFTTLRRDGRPVSLPVWHVVRDGRIYLRTPRRSKKLTRIRNDDRGSFVVEAGLAWVELRAVVVPVRAAVVEGDEAAMATAALDEKYAAYRFDEDQLPAAARATYADMAVVRLEADGKVLTWDNAALVGGA